MSLRIEGRALVAHCSSGPRSIDLPVVVLVHGLGESSASMLAAARALAPDHRVYALDLPGFGHSEAPAGGLEISALADAVAAWLETMRFSGATIAGSSTGCQVVAQVAARHPARIGRVILESPTLDPRVRSTSRLVAAWLRNVPRVPLRHVARSLRALSTVGPRAAWRSLRRVIADHIEDSLPRITVPALVIHGARDAIAPPAWAGEVTRRLPAGRLHVVPGVGHGISAVAPRAFAAAVYRFVRDASHRRAA